MEMAAPVRAQRFRDLGHEDKTFNELSSRLREGLDEKDSAVRINFHCAIAQIRNLYRDRTATGTLRNLIDDFLREAIEDD